MPLPRTAVLRGSIRSFSFKRAGTQARTGLRGVGRRTYASDHGAQKSSDLPWLIGSLVVTVPAAGWLWQQGPTKSDHGHGHDAHTEEKHEDEPAEEPKEEEEAAPKEEDSGDAEGTEKASGKEEDSEKDSDEGKDDKQEESEDDGKDKSDDQGKGKDKEVSPKGTAKAENESKGDKDAKGDISGSNHPSLASSELQKKSEGPAATAKLHGTVDKSK